MAAILDGQFVKRNEVVLLEDHSDTMLYQIYSDSLECVIFKFMF